MEVSQSKTGSRIRETAGAEPTARVGRYEFELTKGEAGLDAVLTIGRALTGKFASEDILGAALGKIAEIVGAEGASILLIDPETGAMSFHVTSGPGAEEAMKVPLPPGAGICGHVARTGEALVVNDAQSDPRLYRRVDKATRITTRNLLCVPLRCGERLWGVLELINKHGGADFDDADLRLTEAVGGQVALALENAHLHTEIVQKERMAAVGQTVSGLAHCVKNVLNGIRSGSAVIDRAMKNDDFGRVREGWGVVRRNNDILGTLVLDMLSLARDTKVHPFPTDVNELADQVCRLMVDRAAERGIDVTCRAASGLTEVLVDTTQLYRCLLNLVSNAVDACGEGGHVDVRVHRARGRERYTISISDDGEGIAPANRAKLFAEFFTTKGSKGTGLGLPVTKKLITAMGGAIVFHSVVGRGTRFVLALPVEPESGARKETDS